MTLSAADELRSQLEHVAGTLLRPRGSVLFVRGDPGTGVYLVRRGLVVLSLGSGAPKRLARRLGPGSLIGLPAALSGKTYSLTAEVSEDAELGFISREAFLEILRQDPSLCFHVMDILSEQISAMRSLMKPPQRRRPHTRKPV